MKNILSYLEKLISIQSESGKEEKIADHIELLVNDAGLYYRRYRNSIVCKIPGLIGQKAMIFNGHIDTVSYTSGWNSKIQPYKMATKQGKIFGLGSSDMKSGIAIMLGLIDFIVSNKNIEDDIWFFFSDMEEIDGSGTKKLLKEHGSEILNYSEARGFILEPTDALDVCYGHRGNMFLEVIADGEGGHASLDYKNKTAIDKLLHFLNGIKEIANKWKAKYSNFYLGSPTLNITKIEWGGESLNVVNKTANAILDIRYTPELKECIQNEIEKLSSFGVSFKVLDNCSYGLCSSDNYWYKNIEDSFGLPMKPFIGSTDQTFFTELGIPMLIYGPGNKELMHKPNEYVSKKNLKLVYDNLVSILTLNL